MLSGFDLPFDALPTELSIFPLTGALLLPRGRLPLQIFEPRYLSMTLNALKEDRLIGMIQPRDAQEKELYDVGCVGRISAFTEADGDRLLITLTGAIRFRIARELPSTTPYRRVVPDWTDFKSDLDPTPESEIPRDDLTKALKPYFASRKIEADWDLIASTADESLVSSLAMMCPFAPSEKQALLEAGDLHERAVALVAIIQMALHDGGDHYPV